MEGWLKPSKETERREDLTAQLYAGGASNPPYFKVNYFKKF